MRYIKMTLGRAVPAGLIPCNPAANIAAADPPIPARLVYVTPEQALQAAEELKGEYRLAFLLARFCGLRVPSELNGLRWANVDLATNVLLVYAPKTARRRAVPLLPVVANALTQQFARCPTGQETVFGRERKLPVLRRAVEPAILCAGLAPWEKLFQNLRASFATDCVRNLPAHSAATILGHGQAVAAKNDWIAGLDDIQRAAGALQKALQNNAEFGRNSVKGSWPEHAETPEKTAELCNSTKDEVGPAGFEPATSRL